MGSWQGLNITKIDKYDSTKSSTYTYNGSAFKIQYGSDAVEGIIDEDDISNGGLVATRHLFAETTVEPGIFWDVGHFDGIFGCAWPEISVNGISPYFQTLMAQEKVAAPVF